MSHDVGIEGRAVQCGAVHVWITWRHMAVGRIVGMCAFTLLCSDSTTPRSRNNHCHRDHATVCAALILLLRNMAAQS